MFRKNKNQPKWKSVSPWYNPTCGHTSHKECFRSWTDWTGKFYTSTWSTIFNQSFDNWLPLFKDFDNFLQKKPPNYMYTSSYPTSDDKQLKIVVQISALRILLTKWFHAVRSTPPLNFVLYCTITVSCINFPSVCYSD